MSSYPYIVFPERYIKINQRLPPLPEEPTKPELKLVKKNWFEKLILWCDDYDDECINERRRIKYEEQLNNYRIELKRYQDNVKQILSDTNISIFREAERKKSLESTRMGSPRCHEVLKGRFDDIFLYHLHNAFGNNITDSIEFMLPNQRAFVPDAAYVNRSTGLCIDIEIDEPYSLPDKKPIHYIGSDEYRNSFFSENGWFVIRFAEEQVAKYPKDCVKYVNDFISGIAVGKMPIFTNCVERWSFSDAYGMSETNYRESYQ